MPESDLSFGFTAALENQLRSLLCACFPNTAVKPKSYAILSGIIKPMFLSWLPTIFIPFLSSSIRQIALIWRHYLLVSE